MSCQESLTRFPCTLRIININFSRHLMYEVFKNPSDFLNALSSCCHDCWPDPAGIRFRATEFFPGERERERGREREAQWLERREGEDVPAQPTFILLLLFSPPKPPKNERICRHHHQQGLTGCAEVWFETLRDTRVRGQTRHSCHNEIE